MSPRRLSFIYLGRPLTAWDFHTGTGALLGDNGAVDGASGGIGSAETRHDGGAHVMGGTPDRDHLGLMFNCLLNACRAALPSEGISA